MINNLISKEYTKIYVTNKKENVKLYFKIDFNLISYKDVFEKDNLTISAKITYLFFVKDNIFTDIIEKENKIDNWTIRALPDRNTLCLANGGIMISNEFRSFGIGSFLLNTIISMAKEYLPSHSLSEEISTTDEKDENKERRNNLYRNIGFNFIKSKVSGGDSRITEIDEIHIDKISDLNLNREFKYIEEIEPLEFADMICKMSNENFELKELNEVLNRSNISYKAANEMQSKTLGRLEFLSFVAIVAAVSTVYVQFLS